MGVFQAPISYNILSMIIVLFTYYLLFCTYN
jgi:hypothetical protein